MITPTEVINANVATFAKVATFAFITSVGVIISGCRVSDVKETTIVVPDVRNEACLKIVKQALATIKIPMKPNAPEVVKVNYSTGEIVVRDRKSVV